MLTFTSRLKHSYVVCALLLGAAATAVAAPTGFSFSVNPLTIEAEATPGQRYNGVVTVYNDSDPTSSNGRVHLRAYTEDWTLNRQGTPNFARAGSQPESCSEWVQISTPQLTLTAKQRQQVRFTINVPANARGLYRTALIFEAVGGDRQTRKRSISVASRIATVLYLQVGPVARRARIKSFRLTPKQTYVTLENTGNAHIRLSGTLQFRGRNGRVAGSTEIPGAVILPGSTNLRDLVISNPPLKPAGDYEATLLLDYGGEALLGVRGKLQVQ